MNRILGKISAYMKRVKNTFVLSFIMLSSFCITATAQENRAPFGFEWGQNLDEIEKITGSKADLELLWGRVHSIDTKSAPSTPPDTHSISLSVDPELGLGRVIWYSTIIFSDAFGRKGKENYQKYKALLSKKYGKPDVSVERFGLKLWDKADEFYQCLAYDGCGGYMAIWTGEEGPSVSLKLNGIRRGEGFIDIIYEGPNWKDIIDEVDKAEEDALDSF